MSQKQEGKLRKEIGVFGGVSLVAGMTIGSGIYYLGSYVLERTNMTQGAALLCWIIGGIVSILGGLCFAELGAEMPVQGGMTTYLSRAYHPCVGFINGFSGFLLTASGSIASLAMAAVIPFQEEFQLNDLWTKIIAIALILFFTWFNLRGVKGASRFQNFTMVVRVIPLILVIFLGIFFGKQPVDMSVAPAMGGNLSITNCIKVIGFATFASLWAYEGWTNLNTVAGQMKKPKRDLPLAIILSMGFITLVYTLFNFAIYRVIPGAEINELISSGSIYLGKETAFRVMGGFGKWIVMIGMCVGIIGTVNGDCLVFPRTYYAMSKGGYFWKSFGTHLQRPAVSDRPADHHQRSAEPDGGHRSPDLPQEVSRHGASLQGLGRRSHHRADHHLLRGAAGQQPGLRLPRFHHRLPDPHRLHPLLLLLQEEERRRRLQRGERGPRISRAY